MASLSTNAFYLMCTGQVESCEIQSFDNIYVKYSFDHGLDWKYIQGMETGMSQISKRAQASLGQDKASFVWNYPVDITFKSTNPFGWPQMVVAIYGFNVFGQDVVRGYASVRIPTTPGRHERTVRLYTPRSSSKCEQFVSWLMRNPPEFFDPKFVAQSHGREVVRVKSNGTVKLVLNVMTKNLEAFGYSVADTEQIPPQPFRPVTRAPKPVPDKAPVTLKPLKIPARSEPPVTIKPLKVPPQKKPSELKPIMSQILKRRTNQQHDDNNKANSNGKPTLQPLMGTKARSSDQDSDEPQQGLERTMTFREKREAKRREAKRRDNEQDRLLPAQEQPEIEPLAHLKST